MSNTLPCAMLSEMLGWPRRFRSSMQLISFHGPITLSAEQLVTVLEPEIDRVEGELHELVPQLVQQRSDALMKSISEAQLGLEFYSDDPAALKRHLDFVNNFDSHRRVLDRDLDDVEAHYDLCKVLIPSVSC